MKIEVKKYLSKDEKKEYLRIQMQKYDIALELDYLKIIEGRLEEVRKEYEQMEETMAAELQTKKRISLLLDVDLFGEYNLPLDRELRYDNFKQFNKKKDEATEEMLDLLADELIRLGRTKEAIQNKIEKNKPIYKKLCDQLEKIKAEA